MHFEIFVYFLVRMHRGYILSENCQVQSFYGPRVNVKVSVKYM